MSAGALEYHDIANVFPLYGEAELRQLADDIAENKLRDSIVLFEGKILDGRNRYRACQLAGIEPSTKDFEGDWAAAVKLVTSWNLTGVRKWTNDERAMAAARLATLGRGRPTERNSSMELFTQPVAAEQFDVSLAGLKRAKQVIDHGAPELVQAVDDKELTVRAAAELTKLPQEEQRQVIAAGAETVKETVRQARKNTAPKQQPPVKSVPPPVRRAMSADDQALQRGKASHDMVGRLIMTVKTVEEIAGLLASGRAAVPFGQEKTVTMAVERLRSGAEWMATLVQGAGFSDEGLSAWLAEGET